VNGLTIYPDCDWQNVCFAMLIGEGKMAKKTQIISPTALAYTHFNGLTKHQHSHSNMLGYASQPEMCNWYKSSIV
jgi:hypothetical protein